VCTGTLVRYVQAVRWRPSAPGPPVPGPPGPAWLRQRGDTADLHKPKPHPYQRRQSGPRQCISSQLSTSTSDVCQSDNSVGSRHERLEVPAGKSTACEALY